MIKVIKNGIVITMAEGRPIYEKLDIVIEDDTIKDLVDKIKSLDNSIATIMEKSDQTSMCLGCTDYEIKCNKEGTTKIEATTTKGGKAIYTINVK